MAEFLLAQGYRVFGIVRRSSSEKVDRIQHIRQQLTLVQGDLHDQSSLLSCMAEAQPDEVYNLAAQSFVPTSWNQPILTGDITALGVTRMLESLRAVRPAAKFYQASSSEMFGQVRTTPQNEETPFYPRSPYGVSKVYGHFITVNYRESYNLFAVSGILFNHESPRRGLEFVTRKITHAAAAIKLGQQKELRLGNIEARRDWGFAGDYVQAMWKMLQRDTPEDYVIATGVQHAVAEVAAVAFQHLGLRWQDYVRIDEQLKRPAEVDSLVGDARKAADRLGWKPTVSFEQLITMMVDEDIQRLTP